MVRSRSAGTHLPDHAQIAFVSALSASAFGLAATGSGDYARSSFENAFKNGIFFNASRK
jgi:hypothetical protein